MYFPPGVLLQGARESGSLRNTHNTKHIQPEQHFLRYPNVMLQRKVSRKSQTILISFEFIYQFERWNIIYLLYFKKMSSSE